MKGCNSGNLGGCSKLETFFFEFYISLNICSFFNYFNCFLRLSPNNENIENNWLTVNVLVIPLLLPYYCHIFPWLFPFSLSIAISGVQQSSWRRAKSIRHQLLLYPSFITSRLFTYYFPRWFCLLSCSSSPLTFILL